MWGRRHGSQAEVEKPPAAPNSTAAPQAERARHSAAQPKRAPGRPAAAPAADPKDRQRDKPRGLFGARATSAGATTAADRSRADPISSRSREELHAVNDRQAAANDGRRNFGVHGRSVRGATNRAAGSVPNQAATADPKPAGGFGDLPRRSDGKRTSGGYETAASAEDFAEPRRGAWPSSEDKRPHRANDAEPSASHGNGRRKAEPNAAQADARTGQRTCYYKTLGVDRKATDGEIKKAYRSKAMEWHPDKNAHRKEESEQMFKEIGESYEVLRDPARRALYDKHGFEGAKGDAPQSARPQPEFHFRPARDIFQEFFGGEDPFANFGFGSMFTTGGPFSSAFDNFGRAPNTRWGEERADPFLDPFSDPFFSSGGGLFHAEPFSNPFFSSTPSFLLGGSPFSNVRRDPRFSHAHTVGGRPGTYSTLPASNGGNQSTMSYSFFGDGGGTRQTTTTYVNGQRTVTTKITDGQGNVTITQELPNGQKTTTVNGVPGGHMITGGH